ncbi:MAG: hypothetical protein ACKOFP_15130 [Actinomycetota bacterium]
MTSQGSSRTPGDRVMRAGAIVTVIGIACTLIAMLPLVVPDLALPSAWWFLSMITGVGLAMILLGLLVSARARGRR